MMWIGFFAVCVALDVFVDFGMEDQPGCGEANAPCGSLETAFFRLTELQPNENVVLILSGEDSRAEPVTIHYSRLDFAKDVFWDVTLKGAVVIRRNITITGDIEAFDEGKVGQLTFSGISFAKVITFTSTADSVNAIFEGCTFQAGGTVDSNARNVMEVVDSTVTSAGHVWKRGRRLSFLKSRFVQKAGIVSAAEETVFDACTFSGIDADGDRGLVAWDGALHPIDANDPVKPPVFRFTSCTFEDIRLHSSMSQGGALVVYDCLDDCTGDTVSLRDTTVTACHTGHGLFLITGGDLVLERVGVFDCQTSSDHGGAVLVLDRAHASINASTFARCGLPKMDKLSHPHAWQLAGGIVAVKSNVTVVDSRFEHNKGWQTGVMWCEDARIRVDVATVDAMVGNTGTEVPYGGDGVATGVNLFGGAERDTDRTWSCGMQCVVTEGEDRPLCPATFRGRPGEQNTQVDGGVLLAVSVHLGGAALIFQTAG